MESKYLDFQDVEVNRKTKLWYIKTKNNSYLGQIKWYAPWRKYCFFPADATIWDQNCLQDINDFLNGQNSLHKAELKKTATELYAQIVPEQPEVKPMNADCYICGHPKSDHLLNFEANNSCRHIFEHADTTKSYCRCPDYVEPVIETAPEPEPAKVKTEVEPDLFCANCGMDVKRGENAGQYHFDCDCFNKIYHEYNSPFLTTDPLEHIKRKQLKENK
ncbi:MAG: hypothetical protein H0X49_03380 [Acidobacteria bacterium]|nr:hypothetical protein [Acidobacteriota bacterium]